MTDSRLLGREDSTERVDYERLAECIRAHGPMTVAFSGGVDSALLAYVAHAVLGNRMRCVIGISASLARAEYRDALAFLEKHGIAFVAAPTREMDNPGYRRNHADRCFFCKDELFARIEALDGGDGFPTIAYGANLDDAADHRPGARAARERRVCAPLSEAGLTKPRVRALARALGLEVWDKPAAPCLASRVPYFTEVTVDVLERVEAAEAGVRTLGFRELRVRHHGTHAKIELPAADHARAAARWDELAGAVRAAGYDSVELEPDGLRSGRLNDAIGLGGAD